MRRKGSQKDELGWVRWQMDRDAHGAHCAANKFPRYLNKLEEDSAINNIREEKWLKCYKIL
jgi:hypothetical protein